MLETYTPPPLVQTYIERLQKTLPKLRLVKKESSALMRAIGWFFSKTRINPGFMTEYVTTLGYTIYIPKSAEKWSEDSFLGVMMHEGIHAKDRKKYGMALFSATYLAPQILVLLSLFAVLAAVSSGWLWMLLFLLCGAPLPSIGRFHWELRAFRAQLMIAKMAYFFNDEQMQQQRDWVVSRLATNLYYFALPMPKYIDNKLKDMSFVAKPEYQDCLTFLKEQGIAVSQ